MTDKKPKETPPERPNREKFPTEKEEIVVNPEEIIPRRKR